MERRLYSINPRATLINFRNRVTFHIQLWTLLALTPMLGIQLYLQQFLLSGLLLVFILFLLNNLRIGRQTPLQAWQAHGFVLLAGCSVLYSTWLNTHQGIYWTFPILASYFFMLPARHAGKAALLLLIALLPIGLLRFPLAEAFRFMTALVLTGLFLNFFAQLVTRLHQNLIQLATEDPLTGCLNRSQLAASLEQALQEHKQQGRHSSLLLLDLDHFKSVNDQYGHHTGDILLKEFAALLRSQLGAEDKLFRLGGEEFLVLLRDQNQSQAIQSAENLLERIRSQAFSNDLKITSSLGFAQADQRYPVWSLWLQQADQCLYQAKHQGRDQYQAAD